MASEPLDSVAVDEARSSGFPAEFLTVAAGIDTTSTTGGAGSSVACRTYRWWVFLVIWQVVGEHIDPILLATPINTAKAFWDLLTSGQLGKAFGSAMVDLGIGYGLAVVVGVVVGHPPWGAARRRAVLNPYINFFQATPLIALVPLVVIWFGVNLEAARCSHLHVRDLVDHHQHGDGCEGYPVRASSTSAGSTSSTRSSRRHGRLCRTRSRASLRGCGSRSARR